MMTPIALRMMSVLLVLLLPCGGGDGVCTLLMIFGLQNLLAAAASD